MTTSVDELMQRTFDDVPSDILLPDGIYDFTISRYTVDKQKNENATPYVEFSLRAVGVVDAPIDDLQLANAYPVKAKQWLSDAALKITKRFFADILKLETEGVPYATLFEMAVGQEVRAKVKQGISKNGRPFVEVERFLPTE